MKKGIKVLLIILGVIIILGLIFFAVDYSRVQKQEKPIFCINYATANDGGTNEYLGLGYKVIDFNRLNGYDEIKIGSWFMKYEDFEDEYNYENNDVSDTNVKEQKAIEELPSDYQMEQAIKDGCVVITSNEVFNKSRLDSFITNTNANSKSRQSDYIRVVKYTIEGAPVITDLEYKAGEGYKLTTDNTRDGYSVDTKVTTNNQLPEKFYTIDLIEDGDLINVELALRGAIDFDTAGKEEYKPMTVASYSKDAETYDTAPSFIGEVTEVNEKMLLVNSEDKNIGDAVWVGVEDTSQYAVGDRIEVFYTGIVLESYPCQIYEIDVRKIEE